MDKVIPDDEVRKIAKAYEESEATEIPVRVKILATEVSVDGSKDYFKQLAEIMKQLQES